MASTSPNNNCAKNNKNQHPSHTPPPSIILFNGFPGVGKYTIAQSFSSKITSPHRFIDNHILIDPVEAICPGRNAAHYALRKQFRGITFEALKGIEEEDVVVVMTACLAAGSPNDSEQFEEYIELATARGVPLIVIDVVCDEETNKERLCSEERRRKVGGKTKLVDGDVLATLRKENKLLDVKTDVGRNAFHFEMDTTGVSVEEAVEKVFGLLGAVERGMGEK